MTMFPPRHLQGATRFALEESPGRVFSVTDKARYEWEHGVPVIAAGERISVSWRFFKDTRPSPSISGPRPPKIPIVSLCLGEEATHVILLSFCNGIGAVPLAANRIWPGKVTTFAWEILPHATKAAQHHIPRYHYCGDLRDITDQLLVWILKLAHVILIVAAGFPCQNNSTLRTVREGLWGTRKASSTTLPTTYLP